MDDLRSVNLSKFVSEAVTAICEAKLKSSDIQAAVQVGLAVSYLVLLYLYSINICFALMALFSFSIQSRLVFLLKKVIYC